MSAAAPDGVFALSPSQWQRLRVLLDEALAQPASARAGWLAALPPADAALKARLAALLAHDGECAFETLPRFETGDFAPRPASSEPGSDMPDTIGPYRLLRELGSGGMASVWLAERIDMLQQRQVALKLPHGAWRRAGLAERLAREREILATLEHPHIARLYDAGVDDDGQPWLALELVHGERIDDHCRARRLSVTATLQLVLQVAEAVAHAHARLVVHRDLKPANILVDAEGRVKLLDFGIAKLLDTGEPFAAQTELTERAGRPLTLHYAAPEQIAGEPLSTACDVHALGVLLYELLAGVRPFGKPGASRSAVEHAVLHDDPLPPSQAVSDRTLKRSLRGDIDTIVLKALKKRPADRYATVRELIDDIERHLQRRPVLARPDSAGYRLRKFAVRNRLGVAAGGAVVVAVIAGSAMALWQAHAARLQQQRAEQVKDFIARIFVDADPIYGVPGRLEAKDLLERARVRLETAAPADPATRIELQVLLAEALLGQQQPASAETLLRQAAAAGGTDLGPAHPLTLRARSMLLQTPAMYLDRAATKAEVASLLPLLASAGPTLAGEQVGALVLRARAENEEGRSAQALATIDEAMAVAERHLPALDERRLVAQRMRVNALESLGRLPEAIHHAEAALALANRLYPPPSRHSMLIDTRYVHGRVLAEADRHSEALAALQRVAEDGAAVFGPGSVRTATYVRAQVRPLLGLGDVAAARAAIDRAFPVIVAAMPADAVPVGHAWAAKAAVHAAAGEHAAAAEAYGRALPIFSRAKGADAHHPLHLRALQAVQQALAGDAGALARIDALVRQHEAVRHPRLADALVGQAEALHAHGRAAEALALLQRSEPTIAAAGSPTLAARARTAAALAQAAVGAHR